MSPKLLSNTLMSVVLILEQLFAVSIGHAGLVQCQDADGGTHVELRSDSCCVAPVYVETSASTTNAGSVDLSGCSENECDDSLIQAHSSLLARSAVRVPGSDRVFEMPRLLPTSIVAAPPEEKISRRDADPVDGLRPIHRGLRATVLLL